MGWFVTGFPLQWSVVTAAVNGFVSDVVDYTRTLFILTDLNTLTGTSKPQSNGLLYSNTVIGTVAADGWAITFGTSRR